MTHRLFSSSSQSQYSPLLLSPFFDTSPSLKSSLFEFPPPPLHPYPPPSYPSLLFPVSNSPNQHTNYDNVTSDIISSGTFIPIITSNLSSSFSSSYSSSPLPRVTTTTTTTATTTTTTSSSSSSSSLAPFSSSSSSISLPKNESSLVGTPYESTMTSISSLIESSLSITSSTFAPITDHENIYMSPLIGNSSIIDDSTSNQPPTDEDTSTSTNVQVFVLTLIFVAIVVGNVPIVITIIFGKLGKTRMYYFLLHLCFADLITGFFNVIPQLIWEITRTFHGGNILCKLVKYLQILGPYLSSFTLTAMSIDRFLAICHPLTNNHLSLYRAKRSISVAWSLSLAFCLPQIFIFSYTKVEGSMDCWGSFPYPPWGVRIYVTWYAVSSFIIPFAVIFYTNFRICCELWKNSRERRLTGSRGISSSNTGGTSCPKRIFRFTSPSTTTTTTIAGANVTINTGHASRSPSSSVSFAAAIESCSSSNNKNDQQQQQHPRPSSLICESNFDQLSNVSSECNSEKLANSSTSVAGDQEKCSSKYKSSTTEIDSCIKNENFNTTAATTTTTTTTTATKATSEASNYTSSRGHSLLSTRKGHKNRKEDKLHMFSHRNRSSTEEVTHQFPVLPSSPSETEFRVHRGGYNAGLSRVSHQNKKNSVPSVEFAHIKRADGGSDLIQGSGSGCNSLRGGKGKGGELNNSPSSVTREDRSNCTHHRSSFLSFLTLTGEGHNNRKESSSNSPSTLRFSRCISQEDEHLRAKIKSVKLTVTVILCYVVCSSPFIFVQLWAQWYPGAQESAYFTGPMVTILMRMSSLNSCVNPWIYLTFNQKLYKALKKLFLTSSNEHSETHRYSADMHVIFSC